MWERMEEGLFTESRGRRSTIDISKPGSRVSILDEQLQVGNAIDDALTDPVKGRSSPGF